MVPRSMVSWGGNDDSISPLVSSASETPAGSLQQSDDSFLRHSKYFFVDGDVTFLVDGFLYCVHRHLFSRDSAYFSTRFAQLEVRDHETLSTIVSLGDVECKDFEAFLCVLYPECSEERDISYEHWRSVLHLSTRWGFTSLRELALRSIKPPTPCDRLILARTYAVDHWVVPALTALCKRTAPLNPDEVGQMNDGDVVLVATVREDIRTQIGVRAAEISRRVEAMQAKAGLLRTGEIDKATPVTFTSTSVSICKKGDPKSRDSPMSGTASSSSVSSVPQSTSTTPRALPSVLATARHIDDLSRITYPEGIKNPKVGLNVNAQDGKFRYDRDFLLQFMNICKEKPDNLPPLDVLGLEPRDSSLLKPRGGSGRNRASNSIPIPGNVRSASIGLGFMPVSMGNSAGSEFQVGQFSTSAREISWEGRSLVAGPGSSPSVSVGGRPPAMVHTIDQSGTKRRDRIRSKRGANARDPNRADVVGNACPTTLISDMGPSMEPAAPLEVSTNSWVATSSHGDGSGLDSESPPIRSM